MDLRHHEPSGYILGPGNNTYVAHCHHYNCFLQRTLRSNASLGMDAVLVDTAGMLFYLAFAIHFRRDGAALSQAEQLAYIEAFFKARGYGNPVVTAALDSGTVTATASHYSSGYRAKFGHQNEPQDFFLTGALQGALMAVVGHDVTVTQTACLSMGDAENVWSVELHPASKERLRAYVADAKRIRDGRRSISFAEAPGKRTAQAVTSSVRNMKFLGDEEEGLIPAFNVYLTFLPSLYYTICSVTFMERLAARGLPASLGARLLKEAGQVCGFYTFGNIMLSSEFALLQQASFGSRATTTESLLTLFGVVNALGWGYWRLEDFSGETLTFSSFNGYESFNMREYFGVTDDAVCYLLLGVSEAILNSVYDGDILSYGGAIDQDYVNRVFENGDGFVARETSCFATGDAFCTITVGRDDGDAAASDSSARHRTFFDSARSKMG